MENLIIPIITTVVSALICACFAKMRRLESKMEQSITRNEAKELLKDKLEVHKVELREIKEDIKNIIEKLDKIFTLKD